MNSSRRESRNTHNNSNVSYDDSLPSYTNESVDDSFPSYREEFFHNTEGLSNKTRANKRRKGNFKFRISQNMINLENKVIDPIGLENDTAVYNYLTEDNDNIVLKLDKFNYGTNVNYIKEQINNEFGIYRGCQERKSNVDEKNVYFNLSKIGIPVGGVINMKYMDQILSEKGHKIFELVKAKSKNKYFTKLFCLKGDMMNVYVLKKIIAGPIISKQKTKKRNDKYNQNLLNMLDKITTGM